MVPKTNRTRKSNQQTSCHQRIKKEIEKVKKTKMGMTSSFGFSIVPCADNFIGCFPEDFLKTASFRSLPVLMMINLDKSGMSGSHWIGLGIFRKSIEIFDPIGFEIFNWPRIPCNLLSFLHKHSTNRTLKFSRRLQSSTSILCGFYCLYYILHRSENSLRKITSRFSNTLQRNDKILKSLF